MCTTSPPDERPAYQGLLAHNTSSGSIKFLSRLALLFGTHRICPEIQLDQARDRPLEGFPRLSSDETRRYRPQDNGAQSVSGAARGPHDGVPPADLPLRTAVPGIGDDHAR